MTKQTKIQVEWIELGFEPDTLADENGWVDYYLLPDEFDLRNCENVYSYDKEDIIKVRPKSLQGIENNNGWIKIESEEDLPKTEGKNIEFWFMTNHGNITINGYNDFSKKALPYSKVYTHYQPIQKPNPPLY